MQFWLELGARAAVRSLLCVHGPGTDAPGAAATLGNQHPVEKSLARPLPGETGFSGRGQLAASRDAPPSRSPTGGTGFVSISCRRDSCRVVPGGPCLALATVAGNLLVHAACDPGRHADGGDDSRRVVPPRHPHLRSAYTFHERRRRLFSAVAHALGVRVRVVGGAPRLGTFSATRQPCWSTRSLAT